MRLAALLREWPIEGFSFDMEGTVVNLEPFHFDYGFAPASRDLGFPVDVATIFTIPHAIGGGDQLIAEGISAMSGGKISVPELRKLKMEYYNKAIESADMSPRPGFLEVFNAIRTTGLPVAIGSLTPMSQAEVILERSGLGKLFPRKRIVLLEDVKNRKPEPDVYLETARRLGIDPSKQLGFEDNDTGVKALKAAGSRAVVVPVYQTPEFLKKIWDAGADKIFLDWRDMMAKQSTI